MPSEEGINVYDRRCIVEWLGYRLDPNSQGRITQNADDLLDRHACTAISFLSEKHELPNPLVYALGILPCPRPIRPVFGPMHGDLHSENILLPASQQGVTEDVRLIDLAFFEPRKPMFFDHAYLELSILLAQLGDVAWSDWFGACSALHHKVTYSRDFIAKNYHPEVSIGVSGWITQLLEGRFRAFQALREAAPNRDDDLTIQFLLAQVAAGLSFVNKRKQEANSERGLSQKQHAMSFLWAAIALRSLVSITPHKDSHSEDLRIPTLRYENSRTLGQRNTSLEAHAAAETPSRPIPPVTSTLKNSDRLSSSAMRDSAPWGLFPQCEDSQDLQRDDAPAGINTVVALQLDPACTHRSTM